MTLLSWQRGGTLGSATVVLLHDWAAGADQWEQTGWVERLHAFDVLACDLPGHGGSADIEIPDGKGPAAWAAQAVLADLQRLHVRSAAVVGVGVGGVVAGHLAVTSTETFHRLVLIGCDDGPVVPHPHEVASALRHDAAAVWHPEAAEVIARARGARNHDRETLARWAEAAAWPAAPRLGALRTPTVLAVGRDDPHHRGAARLASLFHDARLASLSGDAEAILASEALTTTIARFLAEGA